MLDSILLCLADGFEDARMQYRTITPSGPEEYEPLRELMATLIAEGLVVRYPGFEMYKLTNAGYLKFKPRIDAMRALPA